MENETTDAKQPETKKLPCGHDDDFAHMLSIIVGMHLMQSPFFGLAYDWRKLQYALVQDFTWLFAAVKAEQPKLPDDDTKPGLPPRFVSIPDPVDGKVH